MNAGTMQHVVFQQVPLSSSAPCRSATDVDVSRSTGKMSLEHRSRSKHPGFGMPCHASKEPYSWQQAAAHQPAPGSHCPVESTFAARQHASRLTMPPAEYRAWHARLDSSESAQAAAAKRRTLSAVGSHVGLHLRYRQVQASHVCNAPLPPRAVPQATYLEGLAPFAAPPRIANQRQMHC